MRTKKFAGEFESLSKISEFIEEAAQEAGLDERETYHVQLAVDEACSNIIEHGYGGEGKGDLICCCDITEEGLEVVLYDQGARFDPEEIPEINPNLPLKKVKPRGAGLFLMRKLMDKVAFEFSTEHGNILKMLKRKEK